MTTIFLGFASFLPLSQLPVLMYGQRRLDPDFYCSSTIKGNIYCAGSTREQDGHIWPHSSRRGERMGMAAEEGDREQQQRLDKN